MKVKIQEKKGYLAVFSGLIALIFFILGGYHFVYWQKIYPGVSIARINVGNKTPQEAVSLLQSLNYKPAKNRQLIFRLESQEWMINLDKLNFHYQIEVAVNRAFQVGRNQKPLKNLRAKKQAWFQGIDLELEYQLDQDLLETEIAAIASQVFVPAVNPQIEIVSQTVRVQQGLEGRELDKSRLLTLINAQLAQNNFQSLELPVRRLSPLLTADQIKNLQERSQKYLGRKIIFQYEQEKWELDDQELIGFLGFRGGFDEEKIASQAANLASVVNRPPENAAFQFENGKVTQFRPAAKGLTLDQKTTRETLKNVLAQIETENTEIKENVVHLAVVVQEPEITVDRINDLGIKELLGEGVSFFQGSIPSRIHNIVLAASKLNGLLIPPGETFSFLDALGEVSPATGYQSAFVIKEGKTILDDGGGVCQVSTTFFRAALNTGLPIVERHPHSYRVNYYEQGGFGPGLDATVWIPGVDLKFINDTPAHLLIQAKADTQTSTLTFFLYGTSDGRQVKVSKPKIWDQTPPPPDLYQDDPTLPAGTVKRIERANWGAKVSVDWQVTRGFEVLQDRTFYSQYQSWQAVYLRGVGPVN